MPVDLWAELVSESNLKKGWHLSKEDLKSDFIEDLYSGDAFATDLENNIRNLSHRLKQDIYFPNPLKFIDIPKSTLAVRPGTSISIEDRVVLFTIVYIIAEFVDTKISKDVYSYRIKENYKSNYKTGMFREADLLNIPYLKRKIIVDEIDPFEAWYDNWPEFNEKSVLAYKNDGFTYLVTSDIAAYFENIQLPLLRDWLIELMPEDAKNQQKLINLLISFFEAWAIKTKSGRAQLRGLPQGNAISSFLGNLFLMPLDMEFENFKGNGEIKYLRYMDDIRIFTKELSDARKAVFALDKCIRGLHLNVQSAKTKIIQGNEIEKEIYDGLGEEISKLYDEIRSNNKEISKTERSKYIKIIQSYQKVLPRLSNPNNLTKAEIRAYLLWMNANIAINHYGYIPKLMKLLVSSPDRRFTKKIVTTFKLFPGRTATATELLNFIKSSQNIFEHQEAEIIRAFRYLSKIPDEIKSYCLEQLLICERNFYVRCQSAYLLSRCFLYEEEIKKLEKLFYQEKDEYVLCSLAGLLVQKGGEGNKQIIRMLAFHPSEKVRKVGKLFYFVKKDIRSAKAKLNHVFSNLNGVQLCNFMPLIFLTMESDEQLIRELLITKLKANRRKIARGGIKEALEEIYRRCIQRTAPI